MKTFLCRLVLFGLLFWAFNSVAALFLTPRIKLDLWNKHHWVLSRHGEQYSLAVLGSSRAMNTVDASELQRLTKRRTINIGVGGSGAADQYLLLHSFLQNNSIDSLLLQVDYLSLTNYFTYGFRDYIWLCYQDDPMVRQLLREQVGWLRCLLWRIAPFVQLMEFNSQYRYWINESAPMTVKWDQTGGSELLDTAGLPDSNYVQFQLQPDAVLNLERIVQLCRDRGVRLILFVAPYEPSIEKLTDRDAERAAIKLFAEKSAAQLLDYSAIFYNRPELFLDRHHLNRARAIEFTQILAREVLEQ